VGHAHAEAVDVADGAAMVAVLAGKKPEGFDVVDVGINGAQVRGAR
jgi:hypothetical protein